MADGSTIEAGNGGAGGEGGAATDGATGQDGTVLGTTTATVGDFDADGRTDAVDACPSLAGGAADANGDGCPEPPATSLSGGPSNGSFALTDSASFGLGSNETSSTFMCGLNGGVAQPCASPKQYTALAHRTHVLRAWATDSAGTADASPAMRTWTIPLNNTELGHSRGWKQQSKSGYYLNSYSVTTQEGAAVAKKANGVRRIALIATKGPGYGSVRVSINGEALKDVNLDAASLAKRQRIGIATFSGPTSGTVRVEVVSSGKIVRIEGVGLATR